jgi:hypothetical protein
MVSELNELPSSLTTRYDGSMKTAESLRSARLNLFMYPYSVFEYITSYLITQEHNLQPTSMRKRKLIVILKTASSLEMEKL